MYHARLGQDCSVRRVWSSVDTRRRQRAGALPSSALSVGGVESEADRDEASGGRHHRLSRRRWRYLRTTGATHAHSSRHHPATFDTCRRHRSRSPSTEPRSGDLHPLQVRHVRCCEDVRASPLRRAHRQNSPLRPRPAEPLPSPRLAPSLRPSPPPRARFRFQGYAPPRTRRLRRLYLPARFPVFLFALLHIFVNWGLLKFCKEVVTYFTFLCRVEVEVSGMKIHVQIALEFGPRSGMSTQEKVAETLRQIGKLVSECGKFSAVEHAFFVTEGE